MESLDHFVSARSETHLAPNANVLSRAAAYGIGSAWFLGSIERRASAHAFGVDLPTWQGIRPHSLRHLGLLTGIDQDAELVVAPDSLGSRSASYSEV